MTETELWTEEGSLSIDSFPLCWPAGWKRIPASKRASANFSTRRDSTSRFGGKKLTVADGLERVRTELGRMNIPDHNTIISTNVPTRNDGYPRSGMPEPQDPGVAVYFRGRNTDEADRKCIAIDRYDRVADNLAAIAATLDAMRAIERHGGAEILDRAFTGFTALPSPEAADHWSTVLGVEPNAPRPEIEAAYKRARSAAHPDKGGSPDQFAAVERAYAIATGEPK